MRIENIDLNTLQDEGNVLHAEIEYPRNSDSKINIIEIGLCDVRAADNIRVTYDFGRDGWVIYQSRETYHLEAKTSSGLKSFETKVEWFESAFCPAWKFELPEEERFIK